MIRTLLPAALASALALLIPAQAFGVEVHRAPAAGLLVECSQASDGWKCADRASQITSATGGVRLRAIWGDADGSHLYLAGDAATLVRVTRSGSELKAERVPITSRTPFQSDLTSLWGSADGTRVWIGGSSGELLSVGSQGNATRMTIGDSESLVSNAGTTPAITGGWMSASGAMWVTAGNMAHLLHVSGTQVSPVLSFLDADEEGMPVSIMGAAGIDHGGHWIVALADDGGHVVLLDDEWKPSPPGKDGKPVLPPVAKSSPGRPAFGPYWHLYRGIWSVPDSEQSKGASWWAGTWFGRVRRLLLAPGGLAEQCGADAASHGCMIDPALLTANDMPGGPLTPQLSLSNVNAIAGSGPDNVWVAGDHGLVGHYSQSSRPQWSRVETPFGDDPFANVLGAWAERGAGRSVWLAGERVCPGRTDRPSSGVAELKSYWRSGDPDYTNAFECAAIALCPNESHGVCGGTVAIPTGVFPIHDTLDLDTEVDLFGRGEGSVIEWQGTGRHELGGNRVALDIHGRPRGECDGNCVKTLVFPVPPDSPPSTYNPAMRGPISLRHLTVRAHAANSVDSCEGDAVGRGVGVPDAVGVDVHWGVGAMRRGGDHLMIEGVRVCGFKAGLRMGSTSLDNGFRDLRVINNQVGLDLESSQQNDLTDVDAERNGIGVLLNRSEVSLRGLRIADNVTGGWMSPQGMWSARAVRGSGNVRLVNGVLTGFDIAMVQGRAASTGPEAWAPGATRLDVKPLSMAVAHVTGNLAETMLDGRDGAPGRILIVNANDGPGPGCANKSGGVVISQTGGVAQPPVLDVLDECDGHVIIADSNLTLRRLQDMGAPAAEAAEMTTGVFPGYSTLIPSKVPTSNPINSTSGAPSIRFRDNGRLTAGLALDAPAPFPVPAPVTVPGVNFIDRAQTRTDSTGTLRLSLPDAYATVSAQTVAEGTDLVFSVGGKEKGRLTKYGRLGVGTDNPDAEVDVKGDARIDGTLSTDGLQLQANPGFHCSGSVLGTLFMGTGADGKPALLSCARFGVSRPVQTP